MSASLSLIGLGFALGAMHALDADHVMAVSSLSNRKPGVFRMLRFCAHWAFGHGAVLIACGVLLFGFNWQLPEMLQWGAELSVGVLLIGLGLMFLWQMKKQRMRLEYHSHGDVEHVHWHLEGDVHESGHGANTGKANGHAPTLVGVLHGLAGSAPALALVPAASQGDYLNSIGYLVIFSIGVMLSMLVFGLGFGSMQTFLQERFAKVFVIQRYFIAFLSIGFGSFWVYQAL